MTTVHTRPSRRTTTDVTINGECWHPIIKWLADCRSADPDPRLFIDPHSVLGLDQLARKSQRLTCRDDITLRLPHAAIQALAQQARFWESCIDELPPRLRSTAPPSGHFQEMALAIEQALDDAYRPPAATPPQPPTCADCRNPIAPQQNARATLDLDPRLGPVTIYRHLQCQSPRTPKATDPH